MADVVQISTSAATMTKNCFLFVMALGLCLALFLSSQLAYGEGPVEFYESAMKFFKTDQLDKGMAETKGSLQLNPDDAKSYVNLGVAFVTKGLHTRAIPNYLKATELDASLATAHFNLGWIYQRLGSIDASILEYKKAVEADPKNTNSLVNLGVVYFARGMVNRAIDSYEAAIKIDPNFAIALNNLGAAYNRKQMYDKAIEYSRRAVKLEPNYAETHYNLLLAYNYKGMYSDAISEGLKAISLKPDYIEAHYNLALSYEKVDKAKAIEQWERYLKLAEKAPGQESFKAIAMAHLKDLREKGFWQRLFGRSK